MSRMDPSQGLVDPPPSVVDVALKDGRGPPSLVRTWPTLVTA
jgi:hypothetical protein